MLEYFKKQELIVSSLFSIQKVSAPKEIRRQKTNKRNILSAVTNISCLVCINSNKIYDMGQK
jgi:hypothetical protein